ncbi:uncharacterized protein DUF4199 [Mucilaginibacter gracilis]|uniref:Uncharacterized protein DUF4199 n=1 Tax=Mucilaginibacter gracilis TaxID=423350 RepID=A0A495IWP0_9SPHI|nr:DUF4199 domain-containing protein [Mucilaginibacter gracilis]RKR81156.1 uncharacterized protein DUF4199 [Mucilaginibacter gracilis]
MKNAIISGAIIGVLSGLWIFIMHWSGVTTGPQHDLKPIEYTSGLIPLLGLFFGVRNYRENYLGGEMSFFEGLIESFKILLAGGVIAVTAAILYINYVNAGTLADFSGQMFGALLLGLLFSLGVSLLLMNKNKAI